MKSLIAILFLTVCNAGAAQREIYQANEQRYKDYRLQKLEAQSRENRSNWIVFVTTGGIYQVMETHKPVETWALSEFVGSGKFCEWRGGHSWRWYDPLNKDEYAMCHLCHARRKP